MSYITSEIAQKFNFPKFPYTIDWVNLILWIIFSPFFSFIWGNDHIQKFVVDIDKSLELNKQFVVVGRELLKFK